LFGGVGAGTIAKPIAVVIDADGTRYVSDTKRNQIFVYDSTDRFLATFGVEEQFKPVGLAISGDKLYVVDILHHEVQVLDKKTGRLLFKFSQSGSDPGSLFNPTNIAIGPDGDVYISETGNFRIQRFSADGKPKRTYGAVGTGLGAFARPKGVAVDKQGRILVVDSAFTNVQVFSNDGALMLFFGGQSAADTFHMPTGIAIDYESVPFFQSYAHPKFQMEYLVFVVSQYGPNKVDVFAVGRMSDMEYPPDKIPSETPPISPASPPTKPAS